MKNRLLTYPTTNTTLQIGNREIQLTIVDDPDLFLDKLSKEDRDGRLYLPYWTYLWESTIGLAHYVSELGATLSGQHIIEIGCGFGLAGIVACQAGAKVVFTDFEHDALQFALHNSQLNGIENGVFVQMDWNTPCFNSKFDVILASDVIYEEENWQPIMSLLQNLLASHGIVIFSEPNRKNADSFFECISKNGFTFEKTTCPISLDRRTTQINIYIVKRI